MVQTLAPHAAEETLAGRVGPWRADGRAQNCDPAARRDAGEGRPVLAVVVPDQVAWPLVERCGLAQLLRDPGIRRMARDVHVDDPARAELDDAEREEPAEP